MTATLLILAMVAAANPFRARAARADHAPATEVAVIATVVTMVLVWIAAVMAGPFLDLVDVTGPSARIAAGVALLVVSARDVFARLPAPAPALPGRAAAVVPVAFPVVFSPALALAAVAGSAERGVVVTLAAAGVAMIPVVLALLVAPRRRLRAGAVAVGGFGAGIAALVVLDGVYAV